MSYTVRHWRLVSIRPPFFNRFSARVTLSRVVLVRLARSAWVGAGVICALLSPSQCALARRSSSAWMRLPELSVLNSNTFSSAWRSRKASSIISERIICGCLSRKALNACALSDASRLSSTVTTKLERGWPSRADNSPKTSPLVSSAKVISLPALENVLALTRPLQTK